LIVVKKRSNAKFFLPIEQNRYQNPPSGTVVDTHVVKRKGYTFFSSLFVNLNLFKCQFPHFKQRVLFDSTNS